MYATEAFVLSVFGWCWLVLQEMIAFSVLSAIVVYASLAVSAVHLVLSALLPDDIGPRRGYFSAVLSFTLFAVTCMLDTLELPLVGSTVFKPPPVPTGMCCANLDLARTYQVVFFSESAFYPAQVGIFSGFLLVHLIIAGACMLDSEHRTLWPGFDWANSLAALMCARLAFMFDGVAVTLCPDSSAYMRLFNQPVLSISVSFLALMGALVLMIWVDAVARVASGSIGVVLWRIERALNLLLHVAVTTFVVVVLSERGMLTIPVTAAFGLSLSMALLECVWSFRSLPALRVHLPEPPSRPHADSTLSKQPPKTDLRDYVPLHVHTGREKKGL